MPEIDWPIDLPGSPISLEKLFLERTCLTSRSGALQATISVAPALLPGLPADAAPRHYPIAHPARPPTRQAEAGDIALQLGQLHLVAFGNS